MVLSAQSQLQLGISYPFHRTFEEVNLRFYVRYKEDGRWKRGVVFLKEIVPRRMISFIANTIYGENYATLPMRHSLEHKPNGLEVSYNWKMGREWNYIKVLAERDPVTISEGSIEEFITEHYWGYTFIDDTCSGSYEVQHPRWKVHNVKQYEIVCHAEKLYGASFAEALRQEPTSVFLAEGSAISVMKKIKIFAS